MRWSGLALLVVAGLAAEGRADVLRILDDPREAAQARVDIIQQARDEIDAVYFLARNDRITLAALALLREARRRGVGRVRLIVDEKFVVVDGRRYIAGGRNLAESYFGMAYPNFVDRDVYVDGPSAAEATRHFENLWSSGHVADLSTRVSAAERRNAGALLDKAARELVC